MITLAICDDEIIQRKLNEKKIVQVLENLNTDYNIDEYSDGQELVQSEIFYDMVFLDIKMKKLDGIETAKEIKKINPNVIIVFLTSFDNYVYEAFDVEAFNYIVKPIEDKRLNDVLMLALNKINTCNENKGDLIIHRDKSIVKIKINNIIYADVYDRIVTLHLKNAKIEYYSRLKNLEKELKEKDFFRCHKSYIVNLMHVMRFDKNQILLDNDEVIPISRRNYNSFSKEIIKYIKKTNLL